MASLAGLGLSARQGLFGCAVQTIFPPAAAKIKGYRLLGRTGFKVSDIGFGCGELAESTLLEAALDRGINYIDTAENYANGQADRIIGKAIKGRNRKSLFVTTKLGLMGESTKEKFLERARRCLERMQTDYIDCLMMHFPSRIDHLKTEGFHEAARQLKAEGRIRFCGLSNHGSHYEDIPESMEKILLAAAEDGRFDVMLFVYNFIQNEMGGRALLACREKKIGAAIMKSNPVGSYQETLAQIEAYKRYGQPIPESLRSLTARLRTVAVKAETFQAKYKLAGGTETARAAVKFVLSNPDVSTVCCTFKNTDDLEKFLPLSGSKLEPAGQAELQLYAATYGRLYCRHACGLCESECPHSVPVNTIMRYEHYFRVQGREKSARDRYFAKIAVKSDRCGYCSGYCEKACPYGVPVQGQLVLTHEKFISGAAFSIPLRGGLRQDACRGG
jgi:predicted aldo/keto reductase-like oxidoreductase